MRFTILSKLLLSLCLVSLLSALSAVALAPAFHQRSFTYQAPEHFGKKRLLWATWYWTPAYASEKSGGVGLLDGDERPLGVALKEEDFCHAAVQGSVRIDGAVYNYDKQGTKALADCSKYRTDMPHAPYVRFRKSASQFGEGEEDFALIPYRSIAVDPKKIRIGTLFYIPEARGNRISLPSGEHVFHDGYFFAADTGFGVYGNHIDVFNGVSKENPFPWVESLSSRTTEAFEVTDSKLIAEIRKAHELPDYGSDTQSLPSKVMISK